jgi:hypothetical protein
MWRICWHVLYNLQSTSLVFATYIVHSTGKALSHRQAPTQSHKIFKRVSLLSAIHTLKVISFESTPALSAVFNVNQPWFMSGCFGSISSMISSILVHQRQWSFGVVVLVTSKIHISLHTPPSTCGSGNT